MSNNGFEGKVPIIRKDRDRAINVIDAIEKGHSTTMAAQAGGISRRTLYDWVDKGEAARDALETDPDAKLTPFDQEYLWFLEQYEKAQLERKKTLLSRIEDAGSDAGKWQANAWLLERLYPDEFSMKRSVSLVSNRNDKQVFTLNMGGADLNKKSLPPVDADFEIVE
jgi:transposase